MFRAELQIRLNGGSTALLVGSLTMFSGGCFVSQGVAGNALRNKPESKRYCARADFVEDLSGVKPAWFPWRATRRIFIGVAVSANR
jgi:hypothetical protein